MVEVMELKITAWNGINSPINFTIIYQAVQNTSINSLYLKPAMPLVDFALQKITTSSSHGNTTAFISFLPHSKLHSLVTIVTLAKDCI
jgi:hypothetical protein